MKVCIIHNAYGAFSGEEHFVVKQAQILREKGHQVIPFEHGSAKSATGGSARPGRSSVGSTVCNPGERMRRLLRETGPDIVHIHNLYPLISPSILGVCRRMGVPVVMTVHNYRLICPTGLFMVKGRVCQTLHGRTRVLVSPCAIARGAGPRAWATRPEVSSPAGGSCIGGVSYVTWC